MKLANLDGRAVALVDGGVVDLAKASDGYLPSEPDEAISRLADVQSWFADHRPEATADGSEGEFLSDLSRLGPPVTSPRQIFAVGLNYVDHGTETGLAIPDEPLVFTKFASSIAGPGDPIALPTETCDWEVELVAVVGTGGRAIPASHAFDHLAGFCIGQDISERRSQMAGSPPQFSLAKSHRGFTPIGPWLTTTDELDANDLAISTRIDNETVQSARTSDMVFDIATLVSHLSGICELFPGDLIFTGTPSGVGFSRTPARYLAPGNVLHSYIEGLGELRNPCTSKAAEK
ncbi:MAG: fumarylacetoacetate hydrolase family protein [Nocardiaceae bacterium]|nr:fumarylacetoacetate hydrolase family protein [Nocardiaceae bacterium]